MSKELADVIVTAAVALDTVSGNGAAVVEHQFQDRAPDDLTGDGWDSMEERPRFSWRGSRPRPDMPRFRYQGGLLPGP
ncbi:hypothetical protein AB0D57_22265 [Streptomyces sp. NPDC048275]|uniref:hypothetical protein n=1 Tax=Streptomyces sp. NPDC048275 TaxID=3155629 RepID=UPI0033E8F479